MNTIKEYLIAVKGPLTTPIGGGIRSLNVAFKTKLDLFTCLRPVRWFQGFLHQLNVQKMLTWLFSVKTLTFMQV